MTTTVSTNNTTELDDTNNISTPKTSGKVSSDSAKYTQSIAKTITSLPNISPDWTNRRRLVFLSMYFIAGCISFIIGVSLFVLIHNTVNITHGQIDLGMVNLLSSIIYMFGFLAFCIIGCYCFGASWEHMSYRSNVMNMVSKIATSASNQTPTEDKDTTPNPS